MEEVGIVDKQRLRYATIGIGHVWLDTTCPVPTSVVYDPEDLSPTPLNSKPLNLEDLNSKDLNPKT